MVAASIRSKNPGAMWGRTGRRPSADKFVATNAPIPLRWGSKRTEYLNDGFGQGNNIAYFDTYPNGISAQLDLWKNSKHYRDKPFGEAIRVWSGGNSVEQYIAYVRQRVPGISRSTIMNDAFWRSPMAIPFLKAQAAHEAGQPTYPASEEEWKAGYNNYFNKTRATVTKKAATTSTAVVVASESAATVAHQQGYHWGGVVALGIIGVVIGVMIFVFWRAQHKGAPA